MGVSHACRTFELLSQALRWICQHKFHISHMSHILDDFIFFGKTLPDCHSSLSRFFELSNMVNLPIKQSKTVFPSTTVTLHGIEVDKVNQTLALPPDKVTSLRQKLINLANRKKTTLKEMQSLIGSLNFACRAIAPGRAYLRRLVDFTRGKTRANHRIRITVDARRDMSAWLEFLLHLTTDASGFAYGAVVGASWLQGQFPSSWDSKHISIKELLPIVLAVRRWGPVWTNQRVLFLSDNTAVVTVINRQTAKDPQLMSLLRQLIVACLSYNICFRAKHIPGKTNVVADLISRLQIARARTIQPSLGRPTNTSPHSLATLAHNALSTMNAFVQHLNNEGKAPNTIRSFLSAISKRHKACRYSDPTNDYLVAKTVKGVAHTCPHVDQRQPLSTRDLSIIIKSVPTSRCSSYTVILLRAMFSLMFFGFLRIGEVTASPHNLYVSQCRIKPSKLRLVFLSYKHSAGRPFTLAVLPTDKAACPYRRMVDYIKLRGQGQGPLFRYANKLPVQKTAFAKYLKNNHR